MNSSTPSRVNPHVCWLIGVLLAAVVILISVKWSNYPNFVDRMNFAASLASLLLAVLAIVYAFFSNDAIAGSVSKISQAAEALTGNNAKFEVSLRELHSTLGKRFDAVDDKVSRLAVAQQPAAPAVATPAPSATGMIDALVVLRHFLGNSSWNGIKVMQAANLAHQRGKPLNLRSVSAADKRMSYDYAFAYLVACSSVGLFQHTYAEDGHAITISTFHELVRTELAAEIARRIPAQPDDSAMKNEELQVISRVVV